MTSQSDWIDRAIVGAPIAIIALLLAATVSAFRDPRTSARKWRWILSGLLAAWIAAGAAVGFGLLGLGA